VPVDHADHFVAWFFGQPLLKRVVITPTTSLLEFSVNPFLKRLAVK